MNRAFFVYIDCEHENKIDMNNNTKHAYLNAKRIETLKRNDVARETHVPTDAMTAICDESFDLAFDGCARFYPWCVPDVIANNRDAFNVIVITGASGSGKSTLLREFTHLRQTMRTFNDGTLISNFAPFGEIDAVARLRASGLNDPRVWFRPARVLSVGERFRATIALNIDNNVVFDEFTSTIDRNIAHDVCVSLRKYIKRNALSNVVCCSCHRDYIDALQPDCVVDIDEQCVFDCRDFDWDAYATTTNNNVDDNNVVRSMCDDTNKPKPGEQMSLFTPEMFDDDDDVAKSIATNRTPTFNDERDGDVIATFTLTMMNDDVKKRRLENA